MYLTKLGTVVVTFKVPVFVNTLAIPNSALLLSCNVLAALIVTLYKLAIPERRFVAPLNVAIPAVWLNDPDMATDKFAFKIKSFAVVIVPKTLSEKKVREPLPNIDLAVPFSFIIPALAANEPFTVKSPEIVIVVLVVTDPSMCQEIY